MWSNRLSPEVLLAGMIFVILCIGLAFLARVGIAIFRATQELKSMVQGNAAHLLTLHTSIDGRFTLLSDELRSAQALNLTLAERLAVAEVRDRQALAPVADAAVPPATEVPEHAP